MNDFLDVKMLLVFCFLVLLTRESSLLLDRLLFDRPVLSLIGELKVLVMD